MHQTTKPATTRSKRFSVIILVISVLMILFGLAEVITSFTHHFFGLNTADSLLEITLGVVLGIFYIASGTLLLIRKMWAAMVALILLCGDILGRIALVILRLYPLTTFHQVFGIVAGTLIALVFALYVFVNLPAFQRS